MFRPALVGCGVAVTMMLHGPVGAQTTQNPKPQAAKPPRAAAEILKQVPGRREFKHQMRIDAKYDRFKDEVSYQLTITPPRSDEVRLTLMFSYTCPGQRCQNLPDDAAIATSAQPPGSLGDTIFLIDGKRLDVHQILNSTAAGSNTQLNVVPVADFLRIVNANVVEGRVCGYEFTLSPEDLEALRYLASRMVPEK